MGKSPPSLKLRQNALNLQRKDYKKDNHRKATPVYQKKSEQDTNKLIYPNGDTAFKALLSARFCAAIWSHISDCDETFNYWEPMHYLVFGKGLQTWEYSPEFALRSYTYLLFHAIPAYFYNKLLQPNPILIFYFTRCLLALFCSFAEVYFYKSVCREFGVHIGRLCLAFQICSAGMFISSTAFLPSTWAMYMFASGCAAWWQQKYPLSIFFVALGALLGWPFAALLGLPIAFDVLFIQKLYRVFIIWSVISAVVILGPMIVIDSMYYGTLVVAPWNIVKYNVLGGDGPELYGTEPMMFYIINGFLNFNIIWVLALLSPVALILSHVVVPAKNRSTLKLPHALSLSPLFLWLTVFLFQAHKEERFLFPVYPAICLSGAVSVDIIQKLWFRIWCSLRTVPYGTHYLDCSLFIMIAVITTSGLLGISRILALYRNYHASLGIMMELNYIPVDGKTTGSNVIHICYGKEWHRYPSSFFLPNTKWQVKFIQSEFKGILPAPYSQFENSTSIVHGYFNDKNEEEPTLLFNINKCDFLIDSDLSKETKLEPIYANIKNKWKVVKSLQFLNAEKSNTFFRAFYIPLVSDSCLHFGNVSLLQAIN